MSARLQHVAWSCTLVLMLTLAAPLPTSAATCPTPTAPYGFAPECLTQAWRAPATVSNTLAFAEVAQPTADCPTPTTPYAISAACIQLLTRPSVAGRCGATSRCH